MTLTYCIVIKVMSGCYFHNTCPKCLIYIIIRNNWNFTIT